MISANPTPMSIARNHQTPGNSTGSTSGDIAMTVKIAPTAKSTTPAVITAQG